MNKKRAKRMLPQIKELVISAAIENPLKRRDALADELILQIERNFPNEIPPKFETLIKLISESRNHEPNPLDRKWHSGFTQKEILPEAIPYIFAVQDFMEKTNKGPLSCRQALWVSHFKDFYKQSLSEQDTFDLYRITHIYSRRELVSELSGQPVFDTTELDTALRQGRLMDLIEDDIKGMVTEEDSGYLKAMRVAEKALYTESELEELREKRENAVIDELLKPENIMLMLKANQYKNEHPEADEEEIFNYLQNTKDGE